MLKHIALTYNKLKMLNAQHCHFLSLFVPANALTMQWMTTCSIPTFGTYKTYKYIYLNHKAIGNKIWDSLKIISVVGPFSRIANLKKTLKRT